MSYEEKNITVSLTSQLLIVGYYLYNLFAMLQEGELVANRFFSLCIIVILATILVNIIASILTNIILTIMEAIRARKYDEPRFIADERDELISLKGMRAAYIVFSIGVLISVISFALGQPALVMISLIVFFAILGEIIGDLSKIVLYRRGA